MKTKSFLFTLITGIIFNSSAFGKMPTNALVNYLNTRVIYSLDETTVLASEDSTKVINDSATREQGKPADGKMSEKEKRATVVAIFVAGVVGGGVALVWCAVKAVAEDVKNVNLDGVW